MFAFKGAVASNHLTDKTSLFKDNMTWHFTETFLGTYLGNLKSFIKIFGSVLEI